MRADLGAIIAGGRSARYGSPKALAEVGGEPIVLRVVRALVAAGTEPVGITSDPEIVRVAGVRSRTDEIPDLGALGGIHTALRWAAGEDRPGALAVACDMPFLSVPLLGRILEVAHGEAPPDVVAPEGGGPRIIEPLCAWYAVACLPAIDAAIARGDRRMISFHEDVRVARIPLAEVSEYGPADRLFLNVNTPEDRDRADRIATEVASGGRR
ncbi:MAG: molybdenum cofactor guanylyltransferase [Gemmatimonadota bacterium]